MDYVAVTTTGVFCRPGCPARTPLPQNVERYPSVRDALFAGFRPCLRCRPMEPRDGSPAWLRPLLTDVEDQLEADSDRRWRDRDLRARNLDPSLVRRRFQREHGLTFQAYARARRLAAALGPRRRQPKPNGRALVTTRFRTPLGPMVAAAVDEGVALLEFADRPMLPRQLKWPSRRLKAPARRGRHRHLDALQDQLTDYFAGRRTTFDLPLALTGTPFEEAAWSYLRTIPPGETRTYAQGAAAVGRPRAVRAFGRANGSNRLAIVVPCHRVIGSDGELTGYGGGLWRKRALLDLEAGSVVHHMYRSATF